MLVAAVVQNVRWLAAEYGQVTANLDIRERGACVRIQAKEGVTGFSVQNYSVLHTLHSAAQHTVWVWRHELPKRVLYTKRQWSAIF